MPMPRRRRTRSADPFRNYLNSLHEELLSAQEEHDLAAQIAAGDDSARERMVRANLREVVPAFRATS